MSKRTSKRRYRTKAPATRAIKEVRVSNNMGRHSGMGGEYDFNQQQYPHNMYLSPYMQDRYVIDLYYNDWSAKKIINIPVEDMLREGWEFEGVTSEQKAHLETLQDHLGVITKMKQALRLERLLGGCAILIGVDDGANTPDQPINYGALGRGSLRFLNVIPRTRITDTILDMDPLSPGYGEPLTYWINGVQVHRDRLLLFKGDPLLQAPDSGLVPAQWLRRDGFGVSVLMAILDDLGRATGSRQSAYQLIQRAGTFLYGADLMSLNGTSEGRKSIERMQEIINQINMFRGAVVNRGPGDASDPITTITPQFGSVPELMMSLLQVLAAAADIPGSRFFSQAPGSLNASDGGTSLENYYGGLESRQHQELRPALLKLLRVMGPSALGDEFSNVNIDVTFPPLWSMSEKEQAEVRSADIQNVVNLISASLITDAEALEELRARDAVAFAEKVDVDGDGVGDIPAVRTNPAEDLAALLGQMEGGV